MTVLTNSQPRRSGSLPPLLLLQRQSYNPDYVLFSFLPALVPRLYHDLDETQGQTILPIQVGYQVKSRILAHAEQLCPQTHWTRRLPGEWEDGCGKRLQENPAPSLIVISLQNNKDICRGTILPMWVWYQDGLQGN